MTTHDPMEPQLVAWLHGELDVNGRRAVAEVLRRDASARARLAVLEATDTALCEALDTAAAPRARTVSAFRSFVRPALALAAALVVAAVFVFARIDHDPAVARNDLIELRLSPRDGASVPLFSELAFQLQWTRRDPAGRPYCVQPFPSGQAQEQTAKRDDRYPEKTVFLSVSAEVRDPAGKVHQARFVPREPFLIDREHAVQTVTSVDFEIADVAMRPLLWGRPGPGEWLEDQRWRFEWMPRAGAARWFPELPGEWRLELRVDTLPPPQPGLWPTFAEPLRVSTAVVMSGEVSEWSPLHDGMKARLVWATGARAADSTPMAVQLRNDGDRPRQYNHAGITMAKVPQPLHFNLIVDGAEWAQNERLPVMFSGDDLMEPHPVGVTRTIVCRPDWWRHEGKSLGDLPGRHRLQARFHFEPTAWLDGDKELWMGELLTPPLSVDVPPRK